MNPHNQELSADEILLAFQAELTPQCTVTFLYRTDGQIMRALSEQPQFASAYDAQTFLAAYKRARSEFLEGVYTLTKKRIRVVDEELPTQPLQVN